MTEPLLKPEDETPEGNAVLQVSTAERLQAKWLTRMEKMLDDGTATSTDMATLMRFLVANGWNIDPARLPQGLRDKLTTHLSPEDLDEEDAIAGHIGGE